MKIKQTGYRFSLFPATLMAIVLCAALNFGSAVVYADPPITIITCKDGKDVTAHIDDAPPNDRLNDKDYKEACKGHGGYEAPDPTSTGSGSCGGVDTAIISCDADNSGSIQKNGVWGLLLLGINILTAGIGIAAVGGVVYGSILYTTAGDNEAQVKQAKEVIRNVVIGVLAYIAMFALLQFIIPGGIFS